MNSGTLLSVFGDSLAMPRVSEGIDYSSTYAEVARRQLVKCFDSGAVVFNRSKPGASVSELFANYVTDVSYLSPEDQDVLVIQSGVVDCAPRPLPPYIRALVSSFPPYLRNWVVSLIRRNRKRLLENGISWRVTDPADYKMRVEAWIRDARERFRLVVVLDILPISEEIEARSPGFARSAMLFNELIFAAVAEAHADNVILLPISRLVSCRAERKVRYVTQTDGHHLTLSGHQVLGRALSRTVIRNLGKRDQDAR